jgi:hypothetical protein
MARPLGFFLIGAAALTNAVQTNHFPLSDDYDHFAPRTEGINWTKCAFSANIVRECAWFEVPLDWHNATAGKASLAVARYQAVKKPKLGTLFANPGGPGQ